MKKVCLVVSSVMTLEAFLLHQIMRLAERYDVTVVANTDDSRFVERRGLKVKGVQVAIARRIEPFRDLVALASLANLFLRAKFDLVHSISPKAGLLAMAAAKLAGIKVRIHTFTGQVWATRSGVWRWFLKKMDKLLAGLATNVLADSPSQREFLIEQNVVGDEKIGVLAEGSISGVDTFRFRPRRNVRAQMRARLDIADSEVVFLFVGRLTRDKGVLDLARAFAELCSGLQGVHLLVVGPDEERMQEPMSKLCKECRERLHFVDYTERPEDLMAAGDVLCLPSYREGFGSVVIEAGALGLPALASRVYGITDAVQEGETGFLHAPGNVAELCRLMEDLVRDGSLRHNLGARARELVLRKFSQERVTAAVLAFYASLLGESA